MKIDYNGLSTKKWDTFQHIFQSNVMLDIRYNNELIFGRHSVILDVTCFIEGLTLYHLFATYNNEFEGYIFIKYV